MYKPKEEVSVKGYIRKVTAGKLGDIEGLGGAATGLTYSVKIRETTRSQKARQLNTFGAFDLKFTIPDNANLGNARIDLEVSSPIPASGTDILSRYKNFGGRNLRLRPRSNPKLHSLSAARQM